MHTDQIEYGSIADPRLAAIEGSGKGTDEDPANSNEERSNDEEIPVPPDTRPSAPVEEPPESEQPPIGDPDAGPTKFV